MACDDTEGAQHRRKSPAAAPRSARVAVDAVGDAAEPMDVDGDGAATPDAYSAASAM